MESSSHCPGFPFWLPLAFLLGPLLRAMLAAPRFLGEVIYNFIPRIVTSSQAPGFCPIENMSAKFSVSLTLSLVSGSSDGLQLV